MMGLNPVAVRELRCAFRSRRLLMLAVLSLVFMAGVIAFLWPERGVFSLQAQASRSLVVSFSAVLVGMVLVIAPAFSSSALVGERENRSWELLLTTRLTPWRILTGKLLSSTGILLVFVVFTVPFLSAAFVLGALSPAEALRLYGVLLTTALCAGVLGLAISASARHSHGALVRAFSALIAWTGVPWVVFALLRDHPPLAGAARLILSLSPVSAVLSVLQEGPATAGSGRYPGWIVYLAMVGGAGILVFLGLVASLYRRRSVSRFEGERIIDNVGELQRRRRRFPFYLIDPQRRRRGLSDWGNPVFGRELRARALRGLWVLRGTVLCFSVSTVVVMLLGGFAGGRSPDGIKAFALAFQIGLLLLVAPALTCGAVTQERENGQLDLLRMSRAGPATLLAGKVQVALLWVALLLVGCVPFWWIIVVMELNTAAELGRSWAVLGSALALSLCAGLAASTFTRRTAVAAGWAYGFLFCVAVLTLFPHLAPHRFSPAVISTWSTANPFLMAFGVLQSEGASFFRDAWIRHLRFSWVLTGVLGGMAYVRTWWIYRPGR